jgi:predicted Rossmann-fold nucleotide-binding protein
MKLIIAGGRDYQFTTRDRTRLNRVEGVTEVVSGGARGADQEGESWAAFHDIPVRRFLPNWDRHGKRAGMLRNREMAEYADAVALFPGGKGTENMAHEAAIRGLRIYDFRGDNLL